MGEAEYREAKALLAARITLSTTELARLSGDGPDAATKWSHPLGEAMAKGSGPACQRELLLVLIERIVVD